MRASISSLYSGGRTKSEKACELKVMFEMKGIAKVSHFLLCKEKPRTRGAQMRCWAVLRGSGLMFSWSEPVGFITLAVVKSSSGLLLLFKDPNGSIRTRRLGLKRFQA